jgi:hypothetical protein
MLDLYGGTRAARRQHTMRLTIEVSTFHSVGNILFFGGGSCQLTGIMMDMSVAQLDAWLLLLRR